MVGSSSFPGIFFFHGIKIKTEEKQYDTLLPL